MKAGLDYRTLEQEALDEVISAIGCVMQEWRKEGRDVSAIPHMDRIRAIGNRLMLMDMPHAMREEVMELIEVAIMHIRLSDPGHKLAERWRKPPSPAGRKRGEAREGIAQDVLHDMHGSPKPMAVWRHMIGLATERLNGFVGVEMKGGEPTAVTYEDEDGTMTRLSRSVVFEIIKRLR